MDSGDQAKIVPGVDSPLVPPKVASVKSALEAMLADAGGTTTAAHMADVLVGDSKLLGELLGP